MSSSSAVAELEASLQAMLQLKPPGVSGSKINGITALCTANIESESVLIQKLYTHFKKAPATHKLGVLYVVDSVTRKWSEQAKTAGQALDGSAGDGTYSAGVNRVKELLPSLMNDIILSAPSDQKDKIRKLVDIWEKGQTFPLSMLIQFKEKLDASPILSTTPEGSPPHVDSVMGGTQQSNASAAPAPDTNSILAVLANMAKQNQNAPPANLSNMNAQHRAYNTAAAQPVPQNGAGINQQQLPIRQLPGVNVSAPNGNYAQQFQGQNNGVQNVPSNQANPFAGQSVPAPNLPPLGAGGIDPALQAQLALVQMLAAQGIPQEQWPNIIAALNTGAGAGAAAPLAGFPQPPPFGMNVNPTLQNGQGWPVNPENSRDRNGYIEGMRSPPNHFRRRSRSRSPQRNGGWARDAPSNRRGDNSYGALGGDDRGRGGRSGGNNDQYRQRSPPRRGRSPSPPRLSGSVQKWTEYDPNLPKDNIKVLSRTLFVGGVTISESELRAIFDRFGKVQTCIVNKDKRHAFVKMVSRQDAETAKAAMEKNHSAGSMRTRWGVGFGPRDCSDYATGISVIPIDKLTEADRKWMLSAEYGGTGGSPIEGGLVVEEPDIEIGQGVSSKAISRRMQTDNGGKNGPKSGRDYENDGSRGFMRRNDQRGYDERNTQIVTAPPAVPGFQFPFNINAQGMPVIPPNFFMPQQQNGNGQSQPPGPPGYHG